MSCLDPYPWNHRGGLAFLIYFYGSRTNSAPFILAENDILVSFDWHAHSKGHSKDTSYVCPTPPPCKVSAHFIKWFGRLQVTNSPIPVGESPWAMSLIRPNPYPLNHRVVCHFLLHDFAWKRHFCACHTHQRGGSGHTHPQTVPRSILAPHAKFQPILSCSLST